MVMGHALLRWLPAGSWRVASPPVSAGKCLRHGPLARLLDFARPVGLAACGGSGLPAACGGSGLPGAWLWAAAEERGGDLIAGGRAVTLL